MTFLESAGLVLITCTLIPITTYVTVKLAVIAFLRGYQRYEEWMEEERHEQ